MDLKNQVTRNRFRKSLEKIASNLIAIFDLQFSQKIPNLSDPIHRWIDFRLRYIDPMPRTILASKKFPKRLPATVETGFLALQKSIIEGKDINGYQSKGLIKFNDLSGTNRAKRTDLLWADWGISHLHITDKQMTTGEFFSPRKCSDGESWLLFCIFERDCTLLVDIKKHSDDELFVDQSMMNTIYESWPAYMEQFRLKGILASPAATRRSNQDIQNIRTNGLTTYATIDEKVFMGLGMGITTASTPLKVTVFSDKVLNWIDELAEYACDPDGFILSNTKKEGAENPEFDLRITAQGLCVFEVTKNIGFAFPKDKTDEITGYHEKMESLFLPAWALEKILISYPALRT
jgi:hypothetical protein